MKIQSQWFTATVRNLKFSGAATAGMVVLLLTLAAAACSPAQTIVKPTWITPQVSGKTVSIAAGDVDKNTIVHFRMPTATGGSLAFMAYTLDGQTYTRANVCPPCRSIGFSLSGNTLVCNTCGTLFNAGTGDGISGACVDYPKAAVAFDASGGNIVMNADDMDTAYRNTMEPGRP